MTEFAVRLKALHIIMFVFLSVPSPTEVTFNKLWTSLDTKTYEGSYSTAMQMFPLTSGNHMTSTYKLRFQQWLILIIEDFSNCCL